MSIRSYLVGNLLRDWFDPRSLRSGIVDRFRNEEAAATLVRLIQSKHVKDLQLIAFVTYCATALQ